MTDMWKSRQRFERCEFAGTSWTDGDFSTSLRANADIGVLGPLECPRHRRWSVAGLATVRVQARSSGVLAQRMLAFFFRKCETTVVLIPLVSGMIALPR